MKSDEDVPVAVTQLLVRKRLEGRRSLFENIARSSRRLESKQLR
jgi:hypothetical protein